MEFLKVYKYMGRADDGVTPILEGDETLLPLHQTPVRPIHHPIPY